MPAANVLDVQITEEGPRNAVVKLTGVLEVSDSSVTPAISLTDFKNNDVLMRLTGLRIDLLEWSIGNGIEVQLEWNGQQPQQIFPLAGRGRINSTNYGGFVPDSTRPGYDGNINLLTTGFGVQGPPPQNYTVILELIKLYTS